MTKIFQNNANIYATHHQQSMQKTAAKHVSKIMGLFLSEKLNHAKVPYGSSILIDAKGCRTKKDIEHI